MFKTLFNTSCMAFLLCGLCFSSVGLAAPSITETQANCTQKGNAISCAKTAVHYEKQGKIAQAKLFYGKACNAFLGSIGSACYLWGRLLKDPQKAQAAFIKACMLKDSDGCSAAGDSLIRQKRIQQAIVYYKKGCKGNDGRGCHRVARWLLRSQPKDRSAYTYLKRSCTLKYAAGCGYLGWIYEVKLKKPKEAQKLYTYGCHTAKGSVECARLGLFLYKAGQADKALRSLRRACRMGYNRGCKLSRKLNIKLRGRR